MQYKVLALDLDGTLTNTEKVITPRTKAALQEAARRGVCIVLLLCASLFCDWALLAPVFTLLFAWAGGNRTRQKSAFGAAALIYMPSRQT